MRSECLFCGIAAGTVSAKKLFEDEHCVAFADIHPQAPTHLLVIPRQHVDSTAETTQEHAPLLGRLLATAAKLARDAGLERGYRMVVNTGPEGGQTVGHLHVHLLGGRQMTWPPG